MGMRGVFNRVATAVYSIVENITLSVAPEEVEEINEEAEDLLRMTRGEYRSIYRNLAKIMNPSKKMLSSEDIHAISGLLESVIDQEDLPEFSEHMEYIKDISQGVPIDPAQQSKFFEYISGKKPAKKRAEDHENSSELVEKVREELAHEQNNQKEPAEISAPVGTDRHTEYQMEGVRPAVIPLTNHSCDRCKPILNKWVMLPDGTYEYKRDRSTECGKRVSDETAGTQKKGKREVLIGIPPGVIPTHTYMRMKEQGFIKEQEALERDSYHASQTDTLSMVLRDLRKEKKKEEEEMIKQNKRKFLEEMARCDERDRMEAERKKKEPRETSLEELKQQVRKEREERNETPQKKTPEQQKAFDDMMEDAIREVSKGMYEPHHYNTVKELDKTYLERQNEEKEKKSGGVLNSMHSQMDSRITDGITSPQRTGSFTSRFNEDGNKSTSGVLSGSTSSAGPFRTGGSIESNNQFAFGGSISSAFGGLNNAPSTNKSEGSASQFSFGGSSSLDMFKTSGASAGQLTTTGGLGSGNTSSISTGFAMDNTQVESSSSMASNGSINIPKDTIGSIQKNKYSASSSFLGSDDNRSPSIIQDTSRIGTPSMNPESPFGAAQREFSFTGRSEGLDRFGSQKLGESEETPIHRKRQMDEDGSSSKAQPFSGHSESPLEAFQKKLQQEKQEGQSARANETKDTAVQGSQMSSGLFGGLSSFTGQSSSAFSSETREQKAADQINISGQKSNLFSNPAQRADTNASNALRSSMSQGTNSTPGSMYSNITREFGGVSNSLTNSPGQNIMTGASASINSSGAGSVANPFGNSSGVNNNQLGSGMSSNVFSNMGSMSAGNNNSSRPVSVFSNPSQNNSSAFSSSPQSNASIFSNPSQQASSVQQTFGLNNANNAGNAFNSGNSDLFKDTSDGNYVNPFASKETVRKRTSFLFKK
ncbi:hypothetical protein NEMIN01_1505 [Nematocida minor]|uniref:uncharacterized protein n=1 Tax=Nematocida minor TaxID=1912983 RepID=UPI00221F6F92|nr:uncharacterized protein NEMIN01_1505 [Nematocida minor]KAI5191429.1 hypothetical protein NEMIN01_1505 [Nematocida minor]